MVVCSAGAGFFIGDGAGVGKGRQIAGIIMDNFARGRRQAVWLSTSSVCTCPFHTDCRRLKLCSSMSPSSCPKKFCAFLQGFLLYGCECAAKVCLAIQHLSICASQIQALTASCLTSSSLFFSKQRFGPC